MKQFVLALLLLNLAWTGCDGTSANQSEADIEDVKKVWNKILQAMLSKDEMGIAQYTTQNGLNSLGINGEDKKMRIDAFQRWGNSWQNWRVRCKLLKASHEIKLFAVPGNPRIGTNAFVFIKTPNGWKLDEFQPPD